MKEYEKSHNTPSHAPESRSKALGQASAHEILRNKPNLTGMPDNLKTGLEKISGLCMDDVRVHYNSARPAQLNALAYARGTAIHIAPGQERHLPHEAWHVVQQKQGRVRPTAQLQGVGINDDRNLEKEADTMGRAALSIYEGNSTRKTAPALPKTVVQREIVIGDNRLEHSDEALFGRQYEIVRPRMACWSKMDIIFKKHNNTATKRAITKYLTNDDQGATGLKNDIRAMLRQYDGNRVFVNENDLARQLIQDVKLSLLGLDNLVGIENSDGQFSQEADKPEIGRTGKSKTLRIYRTMHKADFDSGDWYKGHGGSLGEALHYFHKSKHATPAPLDDCLVEFSFTRNAMSLIDYTKIEGGDQGKGPSGGKLTGKSEQHDIFDEMGVFSINLAKSKAFIEALRPTVRMIDKVL